jgi:hypothetical protein
LEGALNTSVFEAEQIMTSQQPQPQCSRCQKAFESRVELEEHQQTQEHSAQATPLTAADHVFLRVNRICWDAEPADASR